MLNGAVRPATPPRIEIDTPPISPATRPMDLASFPSVFASTSLRSNPIRIVGADKRLSSAERIPWSQFLRAFGTLNFSEGQPQHDESSLLIEEKGKTLLDFEYRVEYLLFTPCLNDDRIGRIHPRILDPTPYLPPGKDGYFDINLSR